MCNHKNFNSNRRYVFLTNQRPFTIPFIFKTINQLRNLRIRKMENCTTFIKQSGVLERVNRRQNPSSKYQLYEAYMKIDYRCRKQKKMLRNKK